MKPRITFGSKRMKNLSLYLLWGVFMASVISQGMYSQASLGFPELAILFLGSFSAGFVLQEPSRVLLGYFQAIIVALVLTYLLLTLPAALGTFNIPVANLVYELWAAALFRAIFPLPFILLLVGALLGSALSERFIRPSPPI